MSKPSGAPSALVLSPEAPYPILGGGQLRTASIIEYLRARYDVHVITFQEPSGPDPRHHVPSDVRVDVIRLPHHEKSEWARMKRNLSRVIRGVPPLIDRFAGFEAELRRLLDGSKYSVGVIEHFWCAPYATLLRPHCDRLLLNLHNIESILLERTGQSEALPGRVLLHRFARLSAALEHRWYSAFDQILVASPEDAASIAPSSTVYPNAIPEVRIPEIAKKDHIVFSGNLAYQPNLKALYYFRREIWPELRSRHPDVVWQIVGRNHEALARAFSDDSRIVFTGPVEDAVTTLAESRVAVAPLLAGSGTRIKIIEAWAAGLPVVATTIGAEGLPGDPGKHLLIADSPVAFADAVSALLQDTGLATRLGKSGRLLYEEHLTWNAAWRRLDSLGL